ncbi:MAG TPA: class I SAM-dependent methyltransferase [Pyrinomonadaceae bacterium]|nr:class I SAM-dependent methyltransferase [Pyrinomonadaceae bacterium]
MWNLVSTRVTQFPYFDQQLGHPDWTGGRILDFGGNVGGFLVGAGGRINPDNYWCIDLNRNAIERGSAQSPRAHFVHYNRYSSQFNPDGVRYHPIPDCGVKFDVIVAFSIFTHTHVNEVIELVGQLRQMLAPGGVVAFTFCDARYDRSLSDPRLPPGSDVRKNLELQWIRNSPREMDEIVDRAKRASWCVLIDEDLYIEPGPELSDQVRPSRAGESYCSYFTAEYMSSVFPDARVLPPISPEWQHCCVLTKE